MASSVPNPALGRGGDSKGGPRGSPEGPGPSRRGVVPSGSDPPEGGRGAVTEEEGRDGGRPSPGSSRRQPPLESNVPPPRGIVVRGRHPHPWAGGDVGDDHPGAGPRTTPPKTKRTAKTRGSGCACGAPCDDGPDHGSVVESGNVSGTGGTPLGPRT